MSEILNSILPSTLQRVYTKYNMMKISIRVVAKQVVPRGFFFYSANSIPLKNRLAGFFCIGT